MTLRVVLTGASYPALPAHTWETLGERLRRLDTRVFGSEDRRANRLLLLAEIILAGMIFLVDWMLPSAFVAGIQYVILVLISAWSQQRWFTTATAGAGTALICADLYFARDLQPAWWIVITNRLWAIGAIWATAIVVLQRKQAEDELEQFFELSPDILCAAEPSARLKRLNSAFEQVLGYTKSEMVGRSFVAFMHPDDQQRAAEEFTRIGGGGAPEVVESRFRREDGTYRWLAWKISASEKEGVLFAVARDITEQKRVNEELRQRESQLAAAHELARLGSWVWDIQSRRVTCSEELARIFGIEGRTASAPLDSLWRYVHPDDLEAATRLIDHALKQKAPFDYQTRITRPDGSLRIIRGRGEVGLDEAGRPIRIFGVAQDVTAEETLLRQALMFDTIHDGVLITDPAGRILDSNPAAQKMLARLKDEMCGQMLESLWTTDKNGALRRQMVDGLLSRGRWAGEVPFLRADGIVVLCETVVAPLRDEDGRPVQAMVVCRDITERKRAEDSLRKLSGRLLRLQDEERRRLARELHDSTAQIMAALAMNLAQVSTKPAVEEDPRLRKLVSECLSMAQQSTREVRNLSYLLHPPLLDELGLASALRSYVKGFSERTGIAVSIEIPSELGRLDSGVETTLFRIVQEGLANIHRHSGSPRAAVRLSLSTRDVRLAIQDEGCGVGPEIARETASGGDVSRLGVGIPGMRERARQLGGWLEINSTNSGTTIQVALPLTGVNSNEYADLGRR